MSVSVGCSTSPLLLHADVNPVRDLGHAFCDGRRALPEALVFTDDDTPILYGSSGMNIGAEDSAEAGVVPCVELGLGAEVFNMSTPPGAESGQAKLHFIGTPSGADLAFGGFFDVCVSGEQHENDDSGDLTGENALKECGHPQFVETADCSAYLSPRVAPGGQKRTVDVDDCLVEVFVQEPASPVSSPRSGGDDDDCKSRGRRANKCDDDDNVLQPCRSESTESTRSPHSDSQGECTEDFARMRERSRRACFSELVATNTALLEAVLQQQAQACGDEDESSESGFGSEDELLLPDSSLTLK